VPGILMPSTIRRAATNLMGRPRGCGALDGRPSKGLSCGLDVNHILRKLFTRPRRINLTNELSFYDLSHRKHH
jgi:hypothetical protein